MSSLEKKRDDFRRYLEGAGAIDNLTKALIKLYEQQNKPSDAVKFIRKNLCETCPDDEQFEELTNDLEKANKKICHLERELIKIKSNIKRTASEVDLALTKGFEQLNSDVENKSLLKQLLTKEILEQLKEKKTCFKGTLLDCVQSGLVELNSSVGIFACDAEAYTIFAPLFEPLIEQLHGFKKDENHPSENWEDACKLPQLDGSVISIKIQCRRSVECFPFAANMNMDQYEEIMGKVQAATKCMSGDLKGKFHALEAMDKDFIKTLTIADIMPPENTQTLKTANALRFWPSGRGIFVNEAKTFAIWCNQEDHVCFISREQGGNIKNTYDRMVTGVTQVSKDILFTHNEKLGFLTFSPENLGSTINILIQIELPKLPQEEIEELAIKFSLKTSKISHGVYDVSNQKRLGITEFQTINDFIEGVNALVEAENSL